MLYSIINLPNINLGQLQIILAAAGLLSVLATVSCTLFLSAKFKDTLTVLLIPIVVLFMPLFAYVVMEAVSDDHDTIFLILFFSTASDASHGQIEC